MDPQKHISENCPYHPELKCPFYSETAKVILTESDLSLLEKFDKMEALLKRAIAFIDNSTDKILV